MQKMQNGVGTRIYPGNIFGHFQNLIKTKQFVFRIAVNGNVFKGFKPETILGRNGSSNRL